MIDSHRARRGHRENLFIVKSRLCDSVRDDIFL